MILSKDNNNNWTPTAGGTGTFIGTLAAFNAIKDTLPVNTVAYITDDGVTVEKGTLANNAGYYSRIGQVVNVTIQKANVNHGDTFTLPYKTTIESAQLAWWGGNVLGYFDIFANSKIATISTGTTSSVSAYANFTYITEE